MPTPPVPACLPDTLPVFPLQGALLLPGGKLPLNIFEPRYVAMTEDAISSDRLIGMIQPKVKERTRPDDSPDMYGTGCAGRIVSFSETEDGRYLITLRGMCRFSVQRELPLLRGYRRVTPDFTPWLQDLEAAEEPEIDREKLLETLRRYLSDQGLNADWKAVEETRTGDLVSLMCMLCPFDPAEKQALLEATDCAARADVMMSLMEMQRHAQKGDDKPDEHGSSRH